MNSPLTYVNTLIGTYNTKRFSEGNILPITGLPNGLVSFTIQTHTQTGFDKRWFFDPEKHSFEGIRLTHQPSPWVGDYGHLLVVPMDKGYLANNPDTWFSTYKASDLSIKPNLMKLSLAKFPISFELIPTHSGALISCQFNSKQEHQLLLKGLGGKTTFWYNKKSGMIEGKTNACDHEAPYELWSYFVIKCSAKFHFEAFDEDMYLLSFTNTDVDLRLAISFISFEQAYLNYERELVGSLENLKILATNQWNDKLDRIIIKDHDMRKLEMFYTSMYRVFLFPRKFYELDQTGKPIHIHPETGLITEGKMYVDHGFWDTYRTVFPLFALIDQELYIDFLEGIYQYYLDTKKLPKWLSPNELNYMPSYLILAIISDAIVKGFLPEELEKKLVQVIYDKMNDYTAEEFYDKHGYFPRERKIESVNETLDTAYTDFCIYQVLNKYNHPSKNMFFKRSKNYRKLFDPQTGFMRAKDQYGNFIEPFSPIRWGGDYTEGSAWQNSFGVYHDILGLDQLHHGMLEHMIDQMFTEEPRFDVGSYGIEIHEMSEMYAQKFGQCAISNQPSFHIPYIYSELGKVDKTYMIVKWMIEEAFLSGKYPGDEDNGTTAGWFIFGILGFYPMCPGKKTYVMSFPLVEEAVLNLQGHKITITQNKLDLKTMNNQLTYESLMSHNQFEDIAHHDNKKD